MRTTWFWNRSAGGTVRFSLRGQDYSVPEGHAAELPAELAWYPAAVGLLLEPGPAPVDPALGEEPVPRQPAPRRRYPDGVVAGGREPVEREADDEPALPAPVAQALATRRRARP